MAIADQRQPDQDQELDSLEEISQWLATYRERLRIAHEGERLQLSEAVRRLEARYHPRRARLRARLAVHRGKSSACRRAPRPRPSTPASSSPPWPTCARLTRCPESRTPQRTSSPGRCATSLMVRGSASGAPPTSFRPAAAGRCG